MTATLPRPSAGPGGHRPSSRPASSTPTAAPEAPALRRTLLALVASALAMVPLKGIFTDWAWLLDGWLTMAIVIAPAALLRRHRAAGALDIWPGIILLVPWLTARFVPAHAWGGLIPTRATFSDVSHLLDALHRTTRDSVAPIHSTAAVRLVLCALIGLLAALVDLIAVAGRRGALAGVPLLVVYTVSGAVPRHPVSWLWFVSAATGYLMLLGLQAGEDLDRWGRRFRSTRPGRLRGAAVSAPRIAAAAVVLAVAVPVLLPGQSRNLLSDAFHHSGSGLGGFGTGGNGRISPFAVLQGQLERPTPYPLAQVHMIGAAGTQPSYLRVNVLSRYNGNGWQVDGHGPEQPIDSTSYDTDPSSDVTSVATASLQARIHITGLRGNAPVFVVPSDLAGLSSGTTWSSQDQLLLGDDVQGGTTYTETFYQPQPSTGQLAAVTAGPGPALARYLQLRPSDVPTYVHDLVAKVTGNAGGPYAKARAINDYFTDPRNGFQYDIKTRAGDSGSALVDFLKNKRGFCQQYAAAMGVMLRDAGIPARVVLGYMHPAPDTSGSFEITSADAHAWVEAYFAGIGWIPFDPTPASGLVGGPSQDTSWAPHSYSSGALPNDVPNKRSLTGSALASTPGSSPSASVTAPVHASGATGSSGASVTALLWIVGAVLAVALVLTPAGVRARRRRQRYRAARRDGDADALWQELSDTAVDLGYVWTAARSPRQVASWLARDAAGSAASLRRLAGAVERSRYAPGGGAAGGDAGQLTSELDEVTGTLRSGRSLRTRVAARLWPASLGWGGRGTRR